MDNAADLDWYQKTVLIWCYTFLLFSCLAITEYPKKVKQPPPSKAEKEEKISIEEEIVPEEEVKLPSQPNSEKEQQLEEEQTSTLDSVMCLLSAKVR